MWKLDQCKCKASKVAAGVVRKFALWDRVRSVSPGLIGFRAFRPLDLRQPSSKPNPHHLVLRGGIPRWIPPPELAYTNVVLRSKFVACGDEPLATSPSIFVFMYSYVMSEFG